MTYKPSLGFVCDCCARGIGDPTSSLEVTDGQARDLCDDCTVLILDVIDTAPKVQVIEPWSDDPDDLDAELLDLDHINERRIA
jgi:hypothetical protein